MMGAAWGGNCKECGVNMGPYAKTHVCNENARRSFQEKKAAEEERVRQAKIDQEAKKFKLEVDQKLEPELQNFLSSPQGQFTRYLLDQGRY